MTCAQCRHTGGWLEDEATGKPVGRCPCMHRTPTGPTVAADAHPQALNAAVKIIRDAARRFPTLSSNTVRTEMRLAQVPGPVIGAAFKACAKDRLIRAVDTEPSTQPETNGHYVRIYESLIYRKATG